MPVKEKRKLALPPAAIPADGLPPPSQFPLVVAPISNCPNGALLTSLLNVAPPKISSKLLFEESNEVTPVIIPPGLLDAKAVMNPPLPASLSLFRPTVMQAAVDFVTF